MNIRKATENDAYGIAKVQVDSWKTTYKDIVSDDFLDQMKYEDRIGKWVEKTTSQAVYVAETNNGEIVGFSNGGIERTGNYPEYKGELYAIYILENQQRKGLGRLLIQPIINDLLNQGIESMAVWVLEENDSKYFYESLGAKKVDTSEINLAGINHRLILYGWKDIRSIG